MATASVWIAPRHSLKPGAESREFIWEVILGSRRERAGRGREGGNANVRVL